jgi:flagellar biosynthesis protein FliQ
MDSGMVTQILLNFFFLAAKLSAPLLITSLVVGLMIGLFQAVTQINDATLGYLPKVIVVSLAMVLAWPWLQQEMVEYTQQVFHMLERVNK